MAKVVAFRVVPAVEVPSNRWLLDLVENIRARMKSDPASVQLVIDRIINEHVERLCERTPQNAKKYRQLQWRIKAAVRPYADPVARMNKMIELFYGGVAAMASLEKQPGGILV